MLSSKTNTRAIAGSARSDLRSDGLPEVMILAQSKNGKPHFHEAAVWLQPQPKVGASGSAAPEPQGQHASRESAGWSHAWWPDVIPYPV